MHKSGVYHILIHHPGDCWFTSKCHIQYCSISLRKQRNIAAVSALCEVPTVHSQRSRNSCINALRISLMMNVTNARHPTRVSRHLTPPLIHRYIESHHVNAQVKWTSSKFTRSVTHLCVTSLRWISKCDVACGFIFGLRGSCLQKLIN